MEEVQTNFGNEVTDISNNEATKQHDLLQLPENVGKISSTDSPFLVPALPPVKPKSDKKSTSLTIKATSENNSDRDETVKPLNADATDSISQSLNSNKSIQPKLLPLPYQEPSWSGCPLKPYCFEVLKGGVIIETIPIDKSFIVFGRLAQCDIILEHPSISRFHCIVQYRAESSKDCPVGFYVYDLESTHGSYQNKYRLKPKCYNRLHVGHMLKFGGSTRNFVLLGPSDDEEAENPLSVTELQALALKRREEKEKQKLAEQLERETREKQRIKEEEERGIDWGMGPDAVDCDEEGESEARTSSSNPFTTLLRSDLQLTDPKKSLRGWYEREGYDLPEYDVTEISPGRYKCTVRLPVQSDEGDDIVAVVEHRGKKKDAVIQSALEACRLLDKHGLFRQSVHASHERAEVTTHDSDDEDEFLDRTGDVVRKRNLRHHSTKRGVAALTYEQLAEQHSTTLTDLQEMCTRLIEVHRAASITHDQSDDLDVFMKTVIAKQLPDKHKILTWKLRCIELRKEEARLRRLVNVARPSGTAELLPPSLPDELLLPGAPYKSRANNQSPSTDTKKRSTSSGVHSLFLDEDDTPKFKLSKLDDGLENFAMPVPYDKKLYKSSVDSSKSVLSAYRQAAKYIVWNETKPLGDDEKSATESNSAKTAYANAANDPSVRDANNIVTTAMETLPSESVSETQILDPLTSTSGNTYSESKNINDKGASSTTDAIELHKAKASLPSSRACKKPYQFATKDSLAAQDWVPPQGQTGDGRTALNDKYGY